MEKPPKEVSEWMRQIQAKRKKFKGAKKKYDDDKHKARREYMRNYRKAKKQQEAEK